MEQYQHLAKSVGSFIALKNYVTVRAQSESNSSSFSFCTASNDTCRDHHKTYFDFFIGRRVKQLDE